MRQRIFIVLACLVGLASVARGQTATPTETPVNTATATPVNTATATPVHLDCKSDWCAYVFGSAKCDPGSLNLGQSEECLITVPGIEQGDSIIVFIPPSLEAALVHSGTRVVAPNVVAIRISSLVNSTNGASRDWSYLFFNRTQKLQTPGPAPTVTNTPA